MEETRIMLLPSPPSSGSIGSATKMLGVARLLEENGAKICFVIGGVLGDFLRKFGYEVYPFPIPKTIGTNKDIDNIVDFLEWTGLCDDDFIQEAVLKELEAIKVFRPKVIFAETRPTATISANAAKIPLVSIASWSCSPINPINKLQVGRLIKGFNLVLERYGLEKIENIAQLFYKRSDVRLAPTLPELEPELLLEDDVIYTGYILDEFKDLNYDLEQYNRMSKDNVIFIYLSVGALSPHYYMETIIKEFQDTDYTVICGCGFHYKLDAFPKTPDNILFINYIPIKYIISDVQTLIFHGGQDTMLTALLHGTPSITFPGKHFERRYNAEKISNLRLSIMKDIWSFRPGKIIRTIESLEENGYYERCKKFKDKFSNYSGTQKCVEILCKY